MRTSSCTRALRSLSSPVPARLQYFPRRNLSSTPAVRDEETNAEDGTFKKDKRAKVDPQIVEDWFKGEGLPYLNPTPGKANWLGGDIPFPDNPTFRPPPPLSDIVKSSIYDRYIKSSLSAVSSKSESHVQTIRALSEQYGISINRVEAIIRLKQYEQQYQKGGKIQYAFQKGMESYLGIRQERDRAVMSDNKFTPLDINISRQRTSEVDNEVSNSGERTQKTGAARRVWWEMVDDAPDAQPVVPGLITKGLEEHRAKVVKGQQAHAGVALHVEGPPSPQGKPRSVFTFVDTGAKGPKPTRKAIS